MSAYLKPARRKRAQIASGENGFFPQSRGRNIKSAWKTSGAEKFGDLEAAGGIVVPARADDYRRTSRRRHFIEPGRHALNGNRFNLSRSGAPRPRMNGELVNLFQQIKIPFGRIFSLKFESSSTPHRFHLLGVIPCPFYLAGKIVRLGGSEMKSGTSIGHDLLPRAQTRANHRHTAGTRFRDCDRKPFIPFAGKHEETRPFYGLQSRFVAQSSALGDAGQVTQSRFQRSPIRSVSDADHRDF